MGESRPKSAKKQLFGKGFQAQRPPAKPFRLIFKPSRLDPMVLALILELDALRLQALEHVVERSDHIATGALPEDAVKQLLPKLSRP